VSQRGEHVRERRFGTPVVPVLVTQSLVASEGV